MLKYIISGGDKMCIRDRINLDEIGEFIKSLGQEDYKIEEIGIAEIEIKTPDRI